MRRLALLLCACTAAPVTRVGPRRTRHAPVAAPSPALETLMAQRPDLELVSVAPSTDPRRPWPLAELPSLQPHLDLAMARDRCTPAFAERNKRKPELVAYAKAWCRIEAGERDAIAELARLASVWYSDGAHAARLDVINLVTVGLDGQGAIHRLAELGLALPTDLDVLAATFEALGMRSDALFVAGHVRRVDWRPTMRQRCERMLAWNVADSATFEDLEAVATSDDAGPCARRAAATRCALSRAADTSRTDVGGLLVAVRECYNEFPLDHVEERAWLLVTYFRWTPVATEAWIARARDATKAFGIWGAEELALAALDKAVLASGCDGPELAMIAEAAARIAASDHHRPQLDSHIAKLRAMTVERCAALH